MKAKETAFTFLRNTSKYVIPYFQRAYVWNEDNWNDLLNNLLENNENHFLGSIILKSIDTDSGSLSEWSVIDGQQRLTTLSILFRAAYDSLPIDDYDDETKRDLECEVNFLLFNRENKIGAKKEIKIQHSKLDRAWYGQIMSGSVKDKLDAIVLDSECSKGVLPSSRILQCYKYFMNRFNGNPCDSIKIFEFLTGDKNSIVVKIDLEADENEQAIFDTVNSAGVRLTCSDTIKNALFQRYMDFAGQCGITSSDVEKAYKENWEDVFLGNLDDVEYWATERKAGRIKRDNLELLLQAVAMIKNIYDPYKQSVSDLSNVYRGYIKSLDLNGIISLITEIKEYASIYRDNFVAYDATTLFSCKNPIKRILHILNVMDISTLHPYILMLLRNHNVSKNTKLPQELIDDLNLLEIYVIRHIACGVSVSNFNKVCSLLIKDRTIKKELDEKKDEISDSVVAEKLRCQLNNKNATIILFWLELYRRAKDKKANDVLQYCYTLEHIMPQAWDSYWSPDVLPVLDVQNDSVVTDINRAREIRNMAVFEIGNMLLLNGHLNSSIRNYEIQRKVKGENSKKGIEHYDEMFMTKDFIKTYNNENTWNEKLIRNRTESIVKEFLQVWPIL